jgi:hypothetical protein
MSMKLFTTGVAVLGLVAVAGASHAALTQFALNGTVPLYYNYSAGGTSTLVTSTHNGSAVAEQTQLTFASGTAAAALFPLGILVDVTLTADQDGALQYQPAIGQSASNPKILEYQRDLQNLDVSVVYVGATPLMDGSTVLLTTGETVFSATGLYAELTGDAYRPGQTGPLPAAGVTLAFDDVNPPSAGDYISSFFDFTPGGDTVAEDSFTFSDSSKRAVLENNAGYTNSTYVASGAYHLQSQEFAPNGNFSADPEPTINGVPEPAAWALMMVGVGAVGGMVRRRRVPLAA